MIRHFYSKFALTIYLIIAIGLGVWGFVIFKNRNTKVPANNSQQQTQVENPASNPPSTDQNQNNENQIDNEATNENQSGTDGNSTADSTSPSSTDSNAEPVSSEVKVSGLVLAHITSQHCNSNCRAFSNDASLLEYCQQTCGISPIKNVTNCDDKKSIQKDYCTKDLAIIRKDASICETIKDANIKQACKNRISQDIIESL